MLDTSTAVIPAAPARRVAPCRDNAPASTGHTIPRSASLLIGGSTFPTRPRLANNERRSTRLSALALTTKRASLGVHETLWYPADRGFFGGAGS